MGDTAWADSLMKRTLSVFMTKRFLLSTFFMSCWKISNTTKLLPHGFEWRPWAPAKWCGSRSATRIITIENRFAAWSHKHTAHNPDIGVLIHLCGDEIYPSGLVHLTANTEVSTFLVSIPAFSRTQWNMTGGRWNRVLKKVLWKHQSTQWIN